MRTGVGVFWGREGGRCCGAVGPLPPPAHLPRRLPPPPLPQSPVSAEQGGALLALPVVVCLLNLGAPYLYRGLAALERHDSPVLQVYVAVCRCVCAGRAGGAFWGTTPVPPPPRAPLSQHRPRLPVLSRNLILKMVILGILCYHWLGRRVGALRDQVRGDLGGAGEA